MTALLAALLMAALSFCLIELIALYLLRWIVETPGDPSSGDSAGWGFLIAQPVTMIIGILTGIGVGSLAYRGVLRRLRSG